MVWRADAYEAYVRAFGQEPEWAHTADLEELKLNVEKLSDDMRAVDAMEPEGPVMD